MSQHLLTTVIFLLLFAASAVDGLAAGPPAGVRSFLANNCFDCHDGDAAEAGLDLPALLQESDQLADWVRIHDRVRDGEMPPPDDATVAPTVRKRFVAEAATWLSAQQRATDREFGRVRARRLTNLQLERSLHDLLGIDIPLADRMPEEPRSGGFTTVAEGQTMSHFHLNEHLAVVDVALDEAFRRARAPGDEWERTLPAEKIVRRRARKRTREPELIDGLAVTWSSRLIFYGRLPATTAGESGWYRFTVRAKALKPPADRGVWCTVRSGLCRASAPLLGWVGAFETTDEFQEWTFETWLPKGHMLEVRPGDATLKRARFRGGQVGAGEGELLDVSGVAIESITMQRFHRGPDDETIRRLVFGDLEIPAGSGDLQSRASRTDLSALMSNFARRAFRRPVSEEDLEPYVKLAEQSLDVGQDFAAAVRAGYRALLCSPRFLYFYEHPGELDDYAIASRLSYFLWNRLPDEELLQKASEAKLQSEGEIRAQVERMLRHKNGSQFVNDFAAQWLDLSLIDFTEPDRRLYPGFDVIVQNTMLAETHSYLQAMLDENLGAEHVIDSDFTFLNSRLARYYGIDGVAGDTLQRVALSAADHRGGLLTQGAVLKVTANGTTTSPVIRGVWVSERLLGEEVPPPPDSVPAIEPDIRGATSIREMLAKHKADVSCAVCHTKIDPPGFALENYDPSGRWRDTYGQTGRRRKEAQRVDPAYTMADGRPFKDVEEFQALVSMDRKTLARNLAEKMLVYGTGAPISFADREKVDALVESTSDSFGFRSLVHAVACSDIFRSK